MSAITVDFDEATREIVITRTRPNVVIRKKPSDIFDIDPNIGEVKRSDLVDVPAFITHNAQIRLLDCMKDGLSGGVELIKNVVGDTTEKTDDEASVFSDIPILPFSRLKDSESNAVEFFDTNISQISWLKSNTDMSAAERGELEEERTVIEFMDAAMSVARYLTVSKRCITFANEALDPATRASADLRKDMFFPPPGEAIIFTENFMRYFGIKNCSISARRNSSPPEKKKEFLNYDFTINIGGIDISSRILGNLDLFAGNKEKNAFLKKSIKTVFAEYPGLFTGINGVSAKTRYYYLIRQAIIILKELGDLLQVLIKFVWDELENMGNDDYTTSTPDFVVLLQSMLLEKNCVYTNFDDEDDSGEYYSLLEYKTSLTSNIAELKSKIEKTSQRISKQNQAQKAFIQKLTKTPNSYIIKPYQPLNTKQLSTTDPRIYTGAFIAVDWEMVNPDKSKYIQVFTGRVFITVTEKGTHQYYVVLDDGSVDKSRTAYDMNLLINKPTLPVITDKMKLEWIRSIEENGLDKQTQDFAKKNRIDERFFTSPDYRIDSTVPPPLYFDKDFYKLLANDISSLNDILKSDVASIMRTDNTSLKADDLKVFLKSMQSSYRVKDTFRPVVFQEGDSEPIRLTNVIDMMYSTTYTTTSPRSFTSGLPNYGRKSLYEIGLDMSRVRTTKRGGETPRIDSRREDLSDSYLSENYYPDTKFYWFWKEPKDGYISNDGVVDEIMKNCKNGIIDTKYIIKNKDEIYKRGIFNENGSVSKYGFFNPLIVLNKQILYYLERRAIKKGTNTFVGYDIYYNQVRNYLYNNFYNSGVILYRDKLHRMIDTFLTEIDRDPYYGGLSRTKVQFIIDKRNHVKQTFTSSDIDDNKSSPKVDNARATTPRISMSTKRNINPDKTNRLISNIPVPPYMKRSTIGNLPPPIPVGRGGNKITRRNKRHKNKRRSKHQRTRKIR